MAIKYIDPEGGNDANDGSSFALRVRSFGLGLTAARIAPGDEIRMIASPDPASLGSATWTDASATITLASAKNVTIDNCEVNWTASTNITSSLQLSRKQGANCVRLLPATAFTTGKMAYRTLPATLDLSAYQQVSLWYSSGQPPSYYTLQLCSDTTGDVVVNSLPFTLPDTQASGNWRVLVMNFGSALGSGINSISLLANTDPGTTQFFIDNIVACKAPTDADCLTHLHLIGKSTAGEPEWYSINGIDGASLTIGSDFSSTLSTNPPRPYAGTTETVTTYARRPLYGGDFWLSTNRILTESGTAASPNLVSGGWSRTDMATQTGQTWMTGSHLLPAWLNFSTFSFWSFSNIGLAHFAGIPIIGSTGTYVNFDLLGVVACQSAWSLNSGPNVLSFGNVMHCGEGIRGQTFTTRKATSAIRARRISGCSNTVQGALSTPSGLPGLKKLRFYVDKIDNNAGYAVKPGVSIEGGTADIIGTSFDTSGPGGVQFLAENMHDVAFINCTVPGLPSGISWGASTQDEILRFQKLNASATDHRLYTPHWSLQSETSMVHTVGGLSWALRPTSTTNVLDTSPAEFLLGQVAFEASLPVTIKAWLRRSNTGLFIGITIKGGYVAGVPNDVAAQISAAADTWEEVTLSFTPTEAGAIEVFGYGWGGTTFVGYFDDLTLTQV